jgi:hypothetical protein
MKANEAINKIKTILNMQVEVKLAQMKLADGTTVLEANEFTAENEIFVVTADGNIKVPVGEYELENGQILVIVTEGIIGEIKDAAMAEEETESPEEVATEVPEEQMMNLVPKKTIETVSKETMFSKYESILTENVKLKAELEALKQVALSVQTEIKPISFNPENRNEIEVKRFSANKTKGTVDRILEKMY